MSYSEQDYQALAQRAAAQLTRLPGVQIVGVGGREKNGRPTGELVLKVFVEQKKPRAALRPEEIIPEEFEGFRTDVVHAGRFSLAQATGKRPIEPSEVMKLGDTDRYRPIRGGGQISAKDGPPPGSLGFLARVPADPKQVMAVTCHHVLFKVVPGVVGRRVGQPEWGDSCTECCVGDFGLSSFSHYENNGIDAALVRLNPKMEWLAEIQEIGFIRGRHDLTTAEAQPGTYPLRKRGRTLRLTGGTLQTITGSGTSSDPSGNLPTRTFTGGIVVQPTPDVDDPTISVWFAQEGDSGSAIVNDANEVVGLLFMRSSAGFGVGVSIADIITTFATTNSLTIEVAAATRMGDKQVVPHAAPAHGDGVAPGFELAPNIARLRADFDRTAEGRHLVTVWLRHSSELNRLVNTQPRVAALWRRFNGPELFRNVVRAADDPAWRVPTEINGQPASVALHRFLAEAEPHASDALRRDLAAHTALLAALPGRSYDEIVRSLK
ncbi:MAG TPA: hypothetical protein VFJ02_10065 [Vicinamibacterales bacterium]|nr:hypothetical protein [Vicinamibacterales bacterium]